MANARPDECGNIIAPDHHSTPQRGPMTGTNAILAPGMLVRHPDQPDWGVGQVQSNSGGRITVNFREVGKVVLDSARVSLIIVSL